MKKIKNIAFLCFLQFHFAFGQPTTPPPNIVWISWEDVGPHFGAYGDEYAYTPNMDKLAEGGFTYLNAYSNYPVCAPARATIITGQYASSFGGQHMQCNAIPGQDVKLFPQYLREAGYYTTNDAKTHYQMIFDPDVVWDRHHEGSWDPKDSKSLFAGRKPGQPFFTVVNFETTHEGHSRTQNARWVEQVQKAVGNHKHDPKKATLPSYYPDLESVRENVALYYDNITYTDSVSGIVIKQLEQEGLLENTIIMFWGDHGWGLPRGKRWPYISGLRVPLIIRIPEKYQNQIKSKRNYQPGQKVDELVSFVDFAPTILSLAGIEIPDHMQGQAFLGEQATEPRKYVYGGRGRMDETYDCMRAVLDRDFLYIRNYMWHLPYVQTVRTMERQQIMQEWRRLFEEDKLNDAQKSFFQYPKPVEELYDLRNDPDQIHNLANQKKYSKQLERYRQENKNWMSNIRDVGLITEPELDMMKLPDGKWPSTAQPVFASNTQNYISGEIEVVLSCPTPGASIVWKYDHQKDWKPYDQPVVVGQNDILQTKASRSGFYTSPTTEFYLGGKCEQPISTTEYEPWQNQLKDNLIQELIRLKELDLKGKAALEDYYNYLADNNASIRYWATVGVRTLSETTKEKERAKQKFIELIKDSSPIVRIEAGYGLCELGDFDKGIPVLRAALDHQQETVRLYAYGHLDKMGDKAKLAMPFPKIPIGTANNYSHRILIRIYKKLGIKPEDLDYANPSQIQEIRGVYDTIELENLWDYGF